MARDFRDPNHHPQCGAYGSAGSPCRCRGVDRLFRTPEERDLSECREAHAGVLRRVADLLRALDPLANLAEGLDASLPDDAMLCYVLTAGDIRRAQAVRAGGTSAPPSVGGAGT